MGYIYAELDKNNICKAVSDLSGEVIKDTMIPLETYDISLLGMRYDNGEWVEVPVEPVEPEPTQLDRIETQVNTLVGNESALDVLLGVE